ncbi:Protein of unknown function DUF1800 [Fibrisoma limi BUZ 3]|uniref:DUF1800 domain-containing protein n=1 Tax=Fibrisoma limi BUZ 3 TaxID=1185876 RepID=I2GCW7_9BACT|nr:DUF1800 domain-containing protein [Fibrisoma limi]CCH51741.1 Protein of unknown function DUF1800 [Fibrisoma limi BUZ 3]
MNTTSRQQQVQHVYWRAGFGTTPAVIQRESRKPIRKVVRDLLNESDAFKPLIVTAQEQLVTRQALRGMFRDGMLDRDKLKQQLKENNERIRDLNVLWLERMASGEGAVREKLAFFWHGHFACRVRNPVTVQQYVNTLRQHALGTFGDLLMAVSKEPAMLQFLNNQQNRKNAPNENFAREVMELFTLGRGHYTEHDIKEAARAFTGWGFNVQGNFVFRPNQHDDGPKTIFGQTGTFAGEDVIRLLLERKETAQFITGKLYRFLVDEQPEADPTAPQRINALADRFYRSGYNIADLVETILTADWFYEAKYMGNRIKSPVELIAGMQHSLGVEMAQKQPLVYFQRVLGQVLLYPPNVAGWAGGRSWIDSSSLLFRMKLPDILLGADQVAIRPKEDGDVNTEVLDRRVRKPQNVTVDWATFEKAFERVSDDKLPDELAAYLLQQPLQSAQRTIVLKQLKPGATRSEQILRLTIRLMALPEYQLC